QRLFARKTRNLRGIGRPHTPPRRLQQGAPRSFLKQSGYLGSAFCDRSKCWISVHAYTNERDLLLRAPTSSPVGRCVYMMERAVMVRRFDANKFRSMTEPAAPLPVITTMLLERRERGYLAWVAVANEVVELPLESPPIDAS